MYISCAKVSTPLHVFKWKLLLSYITENEGGKMLYD